MNDSPRGPRYDPRFALHQRQPRANKLDQRQRLLCRADPAFAEALRARVASSARFSAFLGGASIYINFERPCGNCGSFKKRTRDRSCYDCHLNQGASNFKKMKAGLAPIALRSRDGVADLQRRERAELAGEYDEQIFSGLVAKRWPMGRLEITFPDGYHEPDLSQLDFNGLNQAIREFPQLIKALQWAGWTVPAYE